MGGNLREKMLCLGGLYMLKKHVWEVFTVNRRGGCETQVLRRRLQPLCYSPVRSALESRYYRIYSVPRLNLRVLKQSSSCLGRSPPPTCMGQSSAQWTIRYSWLNIVNGLCVRSQGARVLNVHYPAAHSTYPWNMDLTTSLGMHEVRQGTVTSSCR